jgi:hypothetical protein
MTSVYLPYLAAMSQLRPFTFTGREMIMQRRACAQTQS